MFCFQFSHVILCEILKCSILSDGESKRHQWSVNLIQSLLRIFLFINAKKANLSYKPFLWCGVWSDEWSQSLIKATFSANKGFIQIVLIWLLPDNNKKWVGGTHKKRPICTICPRHMNRGDTVKGKAKHLYLKGWSVAILHSFEKHYSLYTSCGNMYFI